MNHAERYIGPRNKLAAARGARHRETIRLIMLAHAEAHPLGPSVTAAEVQRRLRGRGIYLAASTVAWHIGRIRLAAELDTLAAEGDVISCNPSNSSSGDAGL